MKIGFNILTASLLIVGCTLFSCKRANEVSIRLLNSKCKVAIGKYLTIDSITKDTSLVKVDNEKMSKLLPEIENEKQWEVFYYGKRKFGKFQRFQ